MLASQDNAEAYEDAEAEHPGEDEQNEDCFNQNSQEVNDQNQRKSKQSTVSDEKEEASNLESNQQATASNQGTLQVVTGESLKPQADEFVNDQPSDKHSQVHPNLEHITSTNSKVDLSDSGENNQANEIDKDIAQADQNDKLVEDEAEQQVDAPVDIGTKNE